MIVEDHPAEIAQCAMALARQSLRHAKIFRDGVKAEAHLALVASGKAERPRAIVLDLDLPRGSGHEILRVCHVTPELANIPIIVWSKSEDPTVREVCKMMGAVDFIPKGFNNLDRLTMAVRKVLTRSEARL